MLVLCRTVVLSLWVVTVWMRRWEIFIHINILVLSSTVCYASLNDDLSLHCSPSPCSRVGNRLYCQTNSRPAPWQRQRTPKSRMDEQMHEWTQSVTHEWENTPNIEVTNINCQTENNDYPSASSFSIFGNYPHIVNAAVNFNIFFFTTFIRMVWGMFSNLKI